MEVLNMHVHVRIGKFYSLTLVFLIIYLVGLWFAMGDNTDEKRKSRIEMENLSMETNRFSRDLLQRFRGGSSSSSSSGKSRLEVVVAGGKEVKEEEDEGEVELNLGLSLGGRFGVDKSSNSNKLIRSSSVASCLPIVRDDDALAPPPVSYPTLVRTSSLPVETEEEWRKRKELQTLRRMEAKRRRSEKQRNLRSDKEGGGGSTVGGGGGGGGWSIEDEKKEIEMNLRGRLDKEQYLVSAKRFGLSVSPTLAAVARQGSLSGGGIDLTMGKGKGSYSGSKMQGHGQLGSQGSVESQGGGSSSSMSELESKLPQGSGELSPASIHSLQGGGSQDIGSSGSKMRETGSRMSEGDMDSPSKKLEAAKSQAKETGTNTLENMPCVFTKGDGPNGRRVDGILYRYGKGEEVRIMCVCHGSFHSPAEFVQHAGGTDVAHPLKHIVINLNASPLL
ncbi:ninja-family protein AFP3-like [Solanum dulcamara]|uniref:ninja-family protein AFP3-like n=1 Tax=Solanum dulcamara TaxID=45834 RepID=UPI0024867DD0|nr:ninja-family protein AFP3-like [Solanum dulcamara]